MNELMLDSYYGRDHVQELREEAAQERLARKSVKANRSRRGLKRVRQLVTKTMKSMID